MTENCKADLTIEGDTYYATITCDIDHVEDYDNEITSFLLIGKFTFEAVDALKQEEESGPPEAGAGPPHDL